MNRRGTVTARFGVGRRESHDASAFYARFRAVVVSDDTTVNPPGIMDRVVHGDARDLSAIAENSVAVVFTSPPYFAGKEYEAELEAEGVPATYLEYLEMLEAVFAECARVIEPGGRIGVNVANLGRRPYRSLSGDVAGILTGLGLLARAELIWVKAKGASGSIAVGSFCKPSAPVHRDVTERILVFQKGRFDRALHWEERRDAGLPWQATIGKDEFLASTLDTWYLPPVSARRIGHPAPFPQELAGRFIHLYTWRGDVVLDPFCGSGQTLIAAARLDRRYLGYDTDAGYVELARRRVDEDAHDGSWEPRQLP